MRPIWSGAVSFGMVTIPVKLYPATEDRRPRFRQLRRDDHSPIRYRKVAEADGAEVTATDIVRGYEVDKGRYVVFTDEELAVGADVAPKMVEVMQFAEGGEIDPVYYRSSYYLAPETSGLKAYRLMLRTLADKEKVAIAKVALRERVHLAVVRPRDGMLLLETMHWPDEIRTAEFPELAADETELRPEETAMAEMLIDNLTAEFDPAQWSDNRRLAIESLARQKVEGKEIVASDSPQPTKVVDLMEALAASVEATKARKAQRKAG